MTHTDTSLAALEDPRTIEVYLGVVGARQVAVGRKEQTLKKKIFLHNGF